MRNHLILAVILGASSLGPAFAAPPPLPAKQFDTLEKRKAVAQYLAQKAEHERSFAKYLTRADAYWKRISSKRSARRAKVRRGRAPSLKDYILEQPPEYTGPDKPKRPAFLPGPVKNKKRIKRKRSQLPVVKDFLRYAKRYFRFVPERPVNEMDYKRAYAQTALQAGISKDQAVRIYGFEASGNGKYDVQAGLESGRKGQPISTALGYNQLLVANTIGLVSEYGNKFVKELKRRAANAKGERRNGLLYKANRLRRMVRYAKSMPYRWSRHVRASRTARGRALHSLILDVDIGPLLQTQKLVNSIRYAKRRGTSRKLTAAELEMLNLTGDGNGYDMISLPQRMREKVPTANFFQRNGYERNPVARRNNTVATLLAATDRKMDYHAALDGGKQMSSAFDDLLSTARLR